MRNSRRWRKFASSEKVALLNSLICTDTSFVIKLLVREDGSDEAETLWLGWRSQGDQVVAPSLVAYEVTSVLRTAVHRQVLAFDRAKTALDEFFELPITMYSGSGISKRALEMATNLGHGAAYDAHYLALAETLESDFWTADRGLYDAALRVSVNARYLGS